MGRSSTTKRTQGIPGQHSKQHENGIVGPGKKVQKAGSNGQVNGSGMQRQSSDKLSLPNPSTTSTTTTTPSSTSTPPLLSTPPSDYISTLNKDIISNGRTHNEVLRRVSAEIYHESSSGDSYQQVMSIKSSIPQESNCQNDVNNTKHSTVYQDNGHPALSSSILRIRPCIDTLAFFCALLQFNHYLLTISYLLFIIWDSTLTYKSFPRTLDQIWEIPTVLSNSIGASSWKTTATCDSVMLILWLLLYKSLQQPVLNIASSMLAVSVMSGDTGQRNSDITNVLACLGVILVSHLLRFDDITNLKIFTSFLPSAFNALGVATDDGRLVPPPPLPPQDHKGFEAWIRTILAIHILTQGTVQRGRDWIIRRRRRDIHSNSSSDPDSVKGAFIHNENTTNETTTNMTSIGAGHDHDSYSSSSLDKLHNPKKKRKVGPLLKIHQPLWTQFGLIKVLVIKSWLQNPSLALRSFSKFCWPSATTKVEVEPELSGNDSFMKRSDNIWITNVTYDEVLFSAGRLSQHSSSGAQTIINTSDIDVTKPFYIRVGKNTWMLTRIESTSPIAEENNLDQNLSRDSRTAYWSGKIYGLSPAQLSNIEFISTVDDSVLFSTNIQTRQAPMLGNDTTVAPLLAPIIQQSPKTALRTSIATQEAKREDERSRQKQQRKDLKSKLTTLRRELERLDSSISSSGSNDDRLRQKLQQANHSAKQADDALQSFEEELDDIAALPKAEETRQDTEKKVWQSHNNLHLIESQNFETFKKECETELARLSADVSSSQGKCDGSLNRIKKHEDKTERLYESNARGRAERDSRQLARVLKAQEYSNRIKSLSEQSDRLSHENNNLRMSLHNIAASNQLFQRGQDTSPYVYYNQYAAFDNGVQHNNPGYSWNSAATYEHHQVNHVSANSASSPFDPQSHLRTRGRSSSMLSDQSGFTQVSDGDVDIPSVVAWESQDTVERARIENDHSVASPLHSVSTDSPALLASQFVSPVDTSSM